MRHTIHRRRNKNAFFGLIMLLWLLSPVFFTVLCINQHYKIKALHNDIQAIRQELKIIKEKIVEPVLTPSPTQSPTPTLTPTKPPKKAEKTVEVEAGKWTGKVSHYSRAGCLGCSPSLTMANGQPLDDNALTIAFNRAPLGTKLKVTNLDNGKSVVVTVTDTGGFERLGRIADLVPAVAGALETKTDISTVLFETL